MNAMTHGVAQISASRPIAPAPSTRPHAASTSLYQLPESVETSTSTAAMTSQRFTVGTPQNTPDPAALQSAVRTAFLAALKGRKQASAAASQIQGLIYREPHAAPSLSAAAMLWLSGADLTHGGVQASAQAVIGRLNECLDGQSRRVTNAILEADDIARLRVFRQQVRGLLKQTRGTTHV